MANFAVIENNIIINLISADSKEIAETVTGLTCVEYPDSSDISIGNSWNEEYQWYISQQPYDSWIFSDIKKSWVAPVEKPEDGKKYGWDNDNLVWVELPSILF